MVTLALLAPATMLRAESVVILDTATDAARARVDLVRDAERDVFAAYFIVDDDATGRAGLYLLREAARRGLDARLLVDAQWNQVARPLLAHLIEEGVEVRLYHKFSPCKPMWWTRRMHAKLVVTDVAHMIAGGRNLEDPYFGFGSRRYVDRDVYVGGPAAERARRYFLDLWDSRHVAAPHVRHLRPDRVAEAAAILDGARDILETSPLLAGSEADPWRLRAVQVADVAFLHDEVARKRKRPGIRSDLVARLDAARERVVIESPYLVVTRGLRNALQRLLDRGVEIRILTNSLLSTDNVFPQAGYAGRKKTLVRMGVELWEYTGPASLHSKTAVIDGRTVIIGSYNLDPRSERLNTELAVAFDDPTLAARVEQGMDANLDDAWRIGPDGRPEGSRRRYPGVGPCKRLQVRFVRLLLPLIRGQL
jgi:putative cardiolipin synthase